MNAIFYSNEKASEMHRRQLLREAEQQRLLAQLPRHRAGTARHASGKFGALLLSLGSRLKHSGQPPFPTILEDRL